MKYLVLIAGFLFSHTVWAANDLKDLYFKIQKQEKPWSYLYEDDTTLFLLDVTSFEVLSSKDMFSFKIGLLIPQVEENSKNNLATIITIHASCKNNKAKMVNDIIISSEGNQISKNHLSRADKMNTPAPNSAAGKILTSVCSGQSPIKTSFSTITSI